MNIDRHIWQNLLELTYFNRVCVCVCVCVCGGLGLEDIPDEKC